MLFQSGRLRSRLRDTRCARSNRRGKHGRERQEAAREQSSQWIARLGCRGRCFLKAAERRGDRYDLIILDPPSFTRTRDKINDALRGYRELHLRSARLLTDGLLATFSCSHHVSAKEFESSVAAGFFDAKRSARIVRRLVQGPDHPVLLHMPETFYLKGLFLDVPTGR